MFIRKSFITNSSSSSFLIARQDELTNEQKDVIIEYVKKTFLGKPIIKTKEELDKYFKEYEYVNTSEEDFKNHRKYEKYQKALEALNNGQFIYSDWVSFEECEYNLQSFYQDLWDKLEKTNNFTQIDTTLDY